MGFVDSKNRKSKLVVFLRYPIDCFGKLEIDISAGGHNGLFSGVNKFFFYNESNLFLDSYFLCFASTQSKPLVVMLRHSASAKDFFLNSKYTNTVIKATQ